MTNISTSICFSMNIKQCSSINSYNSLDGPLKNKQPQRFLKNKRLLILQTILNYLEHINIFVKKGMKGNFSEEY